MPAPVWHSLEQLAFLAFVAFLDFLGVLCFLHFKKFLALESLGRRERARSQQENVQIVKM